MLLGHIARLTRKAEAMLEAEKRSADAESRCRECMRGMHWLSQGRLSEDLRFRLSRPANGVKIACLAPLGALR
jgi:hypothetical protein